MEELTSDSWKKFIKNGYRIFLGTGAACPHALIDLFLQSAEHFNDLEFVYLLCLGKTPWLDPKYEQSLRVNTFFLNQPPNIPNHQSGLAGATRLAAFEDACFAGFAHALAAIINRRVNPKLGNKMYRAAISLALPYPGCLAVTHQ